VTAGPDVTVRHVARRAGQAVSDPKREFTLSGVLMVGGFVLNAVVTLGFHPSVEGDDHEAILTEYADSGAWVATHVGQFAGVLLGLGGLFVLARALRAEAPHLAAFAAAGAVTTAATWAVVQAVDGVALKHAAEAWLTAPTAEEASRFATAETVLWTEWGVQSYFHMMYGVTVILLGAAVAVSRLFGAWIGWVAVAAGVLSLAIGIDVGYRGLESRLHDVTSAGYQLLVLLFVVGILVTELRSSASPASR
jgi:hypothetical protein